MMKIDVEFNSVEFCSGSARVVSTTMIVVGAGGRVLAYQLLLLLLSRVSCVPLAQAQRHHHLDSCRGHRVDRSSLLQTASRGKHLSFLLHASA